MLSVGLCACKIMPSADRDSFTSSFPSALFYFISLSCLITLDRTSGTVSNRSGEHRHLFGSWSQAESIEHHEESLIFQMPFPYLLRWSFCFVLDWYGVLHEMMYLNVKPTLNFWEKSHLVPFLYVGGFGLLAFCLRFFIYIHKRYWFVVFYTCDTFSCFVNRSMLSL